MAAVELRVQLNALLASMYATGTVDEYFQQLQSVQEEGFISELVNLFLHHVDKIIADMARLLNQDVLDFNKVGALLHQLKGSSCSVGAKKMKASCMYFRQFYEAEGRQGCLIALALLSNEFCDVRNKFQTMIQLEQQISACGPK